MKLRKGSPWMPAKDCARTLKSFSVNLIVRDLQASLRFQLESLRGKVVYSDPDFAVVRGYGSEWMMHADHTYLEHPLHPQLTEGGRRGTGDRRGITIARL